MDPRVLHTLEEAVDGNGDPYNEALFSGHNDAHRVDVDPGVLVGRPPPPAARGPAANVTPDAPLAITSESHLVLGIDSPLVVVDGHLAIDIAALKSALGLPP